MRLEGRDDKIRRGMSLTAPAPAAHPEVPLGHALAPPLHAAPALRAPASRRPMLRHAARAVLLALWAAVVPAAGWASPDGGTAGDAGNVSGAVGAAQASLFRGLDLTTLTGDPLGAEALEGRVVLVVNVASFCGYTPQYTDLQLLWDRFRAKGLVVVGVPCNQFGGQEPGSEAEIRNFCSTRYGVTFPLLAKQDVKGPSRSPLYTRLVDSPVGAGKDVGWNFEKFLVSRTGEVIGRFPGHVPPLDPRLQAAIDMALGAG